MLKIRGSRRAGGWHGRDAGSRNSTISGFLWEVGGLHEASRGFAPDSTGKPTYDGT